jgi:DNA-binding response OmpR family regulator
MKALSKGKIFLFHWEKAAATARAAELASEGWEVAMECEEGSRGCKNLKAFSPDIVVFDIVQKGVHSRECARALRNAKSFRETPFIFVDGSDEDIAKVKAKVTMPLFTTSGALKKSLSKYAP